MTSPEGALAQLRVAWEAIVRPSARRALAALVFASVFAAAHVARRGTDGARVAAVALVVAALVVVVARIVVVRRTRSDLRRTVDKTIAAVDPELGAATLRALTLVGRATGEHADTGSPELASLHLERLVARAPRPLLLARAGRAATRWSLAGVALALAGLAAVAIEPFRVVEGADVLAARDGEAPLPLAWIEDVDMMATPPDYLHEVAGRLMPFLQTAVPQGTVVTVRGRPLHPGRLLVLSDGRVDVPFVDDGAGQLVARWTVGVSSTLTIAGRFGPVRIPQPDAQVLTSIPDEAPKVIVDGAPRTVKLIDEPSLSIHYEATDDHGLREVDLVLRSGVKEERRVLSRPTTDAKSDRGGYELRASDPFFKKNYAPTQVSVEARDNDVVSGPKWGKSDVILVVPPDVGEPEARRHVALLEARGAITDLLADRLAQATPTALPKERVEHVAHEVEAQDTAIHAVDKVFSATYGGLPLKGRLLSLARGQMRRLRRALDAEKKTPTAATHQKLLEETESALLAFDVGVRSLGGRDARAVSKRLADVADDAASVIANAEAGDHGPTKAHVDASVGVLGGGGRQLLLLGDLGRDVGEIVETDLRRVARARGAGDLMHAELAVRDLAARLRRPDPSFSGGGGGRASVESGAPSAGEPGEASDADEQMASGERELDDLASEHDSLMAGTQQSLDNAGAPDEREHFKEEAKEHADEVRRAIQDLPRQSNDAMSAEAAAAAAREAAEGMAGALERGDAASAAENGKRAVASLADAKRLADRAKGFFPEQRAGQKAQAARDTIERELAWTEDMLDKLRRAASARAKGDLDKHAQKEKSLADRARELARQGESGDESMPQQMLDHLQEAERKMREAEKALHDGDGQRGLDKQREAQRSLEMAKQERGEEASREPSSDGDHGSPQGKADIPGKDKHQGPEAFRKRVLEGLGASADPLLRDAVKRYAEGLLK